MNSLLKTSILLTIFTMSILSSGAASVIHSITSPNGKISVTFKDNKGELFYSVSKNNKPILKDSRLGFILNKNEKFYSNFSITGVDSSVYDEKWEQPWGESHIVKNNYKELSVNVAEKSGKKRMLIIRFRVYDDGFGFRYEFPKQNGFDSFEIAKEMTQFSFPSKVMGWWIPAYNEVYYESIAHHTLISAMDTVCTPLTLETSDGHYLAIHEAALTDYAKMNLYPSDSLTLTCDLSPWNNGVKVYAKTPYVTPWRTMIIAENINDLVTSNIMLNLNEPSQIEDVSWIKPGRYIGIWWDIHLGKYTWSSGPKHGATTENTKRYIDFAAANGFSGVLVEGWNVGWDGDWTKNGATLDFTVAYPDFDIAAITKYAKEKGIELIGHHETAGMATNYENQLDKAFEFYQRYDVHVVKTGYVNPKLDNKELHDGQFAVRHYRKVVETAAKYHIMIDNHEPVMPTGLQRTWPNLMTQEGVRGQEYDAWSTDGGNPPEHTTVVPFLRGLAGPMDFTPGTFNFNNPKMPNTRVRTTLAKQLALFVVLYSPLQMASDAPENYEGNIAFDFIKSVPTTWENTNVPDAIIGDYAIFARQQRDSANWYVGCITDENPRDLLVNFSFLEKGARYKAKFYMDGKDADWKTNPTSVEITESEVDASKVIPVHLAAGGGCAIQLIKL